MRPWLRCAALAGMASTLAGCPANIPAGRYGVREVRFRGVEQMDPAALAACLGTRRRARVSIDFGLRGTPVCGQPPFDADHLAVDLWDWWWEPWPLFDESVFERDVERVERWYRARGFYDARVVATEIDPPLAARTDREGEGCGSGSGEDCALEVTFTVEEGEPSLVERSSLRGIEPLPESVRAGLRAAIRLQRGERFDETLYEQSKRDMRSLLQNEGYASATVRGEVKVSRDRRSVFQIFVIEPGLPSVVGRVCVRGFRAVDPRSGQTTRALPPQSLLDVAALDAGSPYSLTAMQDAQRALYSLGVVSGVEVAPMRDPGEETVRIGERDEEELCNPGPSAIPPGHQAVDILVQISVGTLERFGFGVGIQAGQALTVGVTPTFADQQDAAQWDLHFSVLGEHRNLFDRLIRGRLEVRPRAIFQMPFLNLTPAEPMPFGVQTTGSLRWPAFAEPRTNLLVTVRHDLGPMPFTNFFRSELDGMVGLDRTFFEGRLYAGAFLHANWFYPTDRQPVEPQLQLPETGAMWLEQVMRLDLRDDPRNPTQGVFFGLSSQQSVQPLGSWDFVRVVGEVRGYIPIPQLNMVLASRFELGVMEVLGTSLDPTNVYQLAQLGPPALHLRGGGASSNRGFLPGLLGDVEQIYVPAPRSEAEIASGVPARARPVRISGGTRSWEASLELRIALTPSLGVVLFGDAGDVNRFRPGDPVDAQFRFDHPQMAFGLGVRYRTIIGPVRFDVALRPDELQVFGANDTLPPVCGATRGDRCRPANRFDFLGLFDFPGAFHITVGEAF